MSRTVKKSKGVGKEYWSRRCSKKHGEIPGRFTKKMTHKRERREALDSIDTGSV